MTAKAHEGADWDIIADRSGSSRFPKVPDDSEILPEEREDWEAFQVRYRKVQEDKHELPFRHRIAGGFFGLMASPPNASGLTFVGRKIIEQQGKPGSFSSADHEMIDLVLSFDSGHWGLLANHTPFAVASGIPFETIRALRDGREEQLSEDERLVVAFIRATRDGTMTDETWFAMVERLGTERGAVELAFFVLVLLVHVRLNQVFDEVQILPEEYDDLLSRLEAGQYPLPEVLHFGPEETRPVPTVPYDPKS